MRSIVAFHRAVRNDLNEYAEELALNSPAIDVGPIKDFQVHELKRLLAQSAGQPKGAYELYDDVYELEFVRGKVWVRFCVIPEGRKQVRITVLGWKRCPYRP